MATGQALAAAAKRHAVSRPRMRIRPEPLRLTKRPAHRAGRADAPRAGRGRWGEGLRRGGKGRYLVVSLGMRASGPTNCGLLAGTLGRGVFTPGAPARPRRSMGVSGGAPPQAARGRATAGFLVISSSRVSFEASSRPGRADHRLQGLVRRPRLQMGSATTPAIRTAGGQRRPPFVPAKGPLAPGASGSQSRAQPLRMGRRSAGDVAALRRRSRPARHGESLFGAPRVGAAGCRVPLEAHWRNSHCHGRPAEPLKRGGGGGGEAGRAESSHTAGARERRARPSSSIAPSGSGPKLSGAGPTLGKPGDDVRPLRLLAAGVRPGWGLACARQAGEGGFASPAARPAGRQPRHGPGQAARR